MASSSGGTETDDEWDTTSGSGTSTGDVPDPGCPNGVVEDGEICDDGNWVDNDGCDASCSPSAVVEISAGWSHTCARLASGTVRCWGDNFLGKLGYGNVDSIGDNETPASAGDVDVGGTVTQISASIGWDVDILGHTCARLQSGHVRCWGSGLYGQLGHGSTDDIVDAALADDIDVGGFVTQVAAGGANTCAVLASGAVRCWGMGAGYGSTEPIGDNELPASAGDVPVGAVTQVAGGLYHTCVVTASSTVRCWGWNGYGALGYGNTSIIGDNEIPASAGDVDVGGSVVQVSAGLDHTCARLESGSVRCWGYGGSGELGYGDTETIGDDETPASAGDVDVGGAVTQIAAGGQHTCALLDSGNIRCWGGNPVGQLGYGHTEVIGDNETPASAGDVDVGGTVVQVTAGGEHTCALLESGSVRCWGAGHFGQLGYGNQEDIGDNETPASAGDVPVL